ncbi:hypothetical protein C8R47DRAFT_1078031 [Mycena vitilis]|nr:hypothetical protein C8R47DRAFT_1078031 [Mycena vitilis]
MALEHAVKKKNLGGGQAQGKGKGRIMRRKTLGGHIVGTFDNWLEAKASLSGYPDSGNRGFNSIDECIDAWQKLCVLGIHPHPVDPDFLSVPDESASAFVNTSPRKSRTLRAPTRDASSASASTKVERLAAPTRTASEKAQVLADLKHFCSPIGRPPPSPTKRGESAAAGGAHESPYVNFAIRGGGIISSSPMRSEQRYLESQRRGEQPDMLVTRSFEQASLFALEGAEDNAEDFNETRNGRATTRQRAKQGLPPLKPGKPGWVKGTKLPWLQGYKQAFLDAVEVKKNGVLYDTIAHDYLSIYGYNTAWDADLEPGQTVADDVDPDEDINLLSPEEAAARAEYFKKLRNKIGVWLNGSTGAEVFGKAGLEPVAPVKPRVLHFFSNRFYDELIKDRVAARWAKVKTRPNPPAIVALRNKVTKEIWGEQTEAFQNALLATRESDHAIVQKAYTMATSGEVPRTAEEYGVALNNSAYYLQPFVDAAAERYGMNVSLLMCGPIPDRGGRIEVRR